MSRVVQAPERIHMRGLYGIDAAAEWLSLSPSTVKKLVRRGDLTTVKVGHRTLVKADELDRFVADLRAAS
jgi:excisionase family DNA binding protein